MRTATHTRLVKPGGCLRESARPFLVRDPGRTKKKASLVSKARRLTLWMQRACTLTPSSGRVSQPVPRCSGSTHPALVQNIPKNMGCPRQPCPHQRGGAQMDPRSGHIAPRSRSAPLPLPGGGARSRRGGAAPGVHERAPFFLLLSKRGATTATCDCTTEEKTQKGQKGQQGNVRGSKTESQVLIHHPSISHQRELIP